MFLLDFSSDLDYSLAFRFLYQCGERITFYQHFNTYQGEVSQMGANGYNSFSVRKGIIQIFGSMDTYPVQEVILMFCSRKEGFSTTEPYVFCQNSCDIFYVLIVTRRAKSNL